MFSNLILINLFDGDCKLTLATREVKSLKRSGFVHSLKYGIRSYIIRRKESDLLKPTTQNAFSSGTVKKGYTVVTLLYEKFYKIL